MANIKLPSMLSYAGSIKPGAGLYEAVIGTGEKSHRVPVEVKETSLKGTISSHKDLKGAFEADAKAIGRANLQTIHQAILPPETTGFEISYTLTIIPNSLKANNCNVAEVGAALTNFTKRYYEIGGGHFLASRYVTNLLRGSWLWRNADQFEAGRIEVTAKIDGVERVFSNKSINARTSLKPVAGSEALIDLVGKALAGEIRDPDTGFSKSVVLRVKAIMEAYPGQEVYPSQEFENEKNQEDISRILASVKTQGGLNQAFMHPQKIGNSLRRIDDWYTPMDGFELSPLPIEPLGVDTSMQVAHRAQNGHDFYTLLEKRFDALVKELEGATDVNSLNADIHYLVSVLIRGGVFSGEKKEKKATKKAED